MSRVRLSEEAETDLIEIWAYIAQDSPDAADQFVDRVYETCITLSKSPGMGRDRSDLLRGIRSYPVGTYLIFYRKSRSSIEVARVLSGFRNLPPLLHSR